MLASWCARPHVLAGHGALLVVLGALLPWNVSHAPEAPNLSRLVAAANKALERYAVPSRSADVLPGLVTQIRGFDDAAAARALLDLYDENHRRTKKLARRVRVLAQRHAALPANPRAQRDQVERDLLATYRDLLQVQRETTDAMEETICLEIRELRSAASLGVLERRVRRGGNARLVEALCEPFRATRSMRAVPALLIALDACRPRAHAPIYRALSEITGATVPEKPSLWKKWWKKFKIEGGAA